MSDRPSLEVTAPPIKSSWVEATTMSAPAAVCTGTGVPEELSNSAPALMELPGLMETMLPAMVSPLSVSRPAMRPPCSSMNDVSVPISACEARPWTSMRPAIRMEPLASMSMTLPSPKLSIELPTSVTRLFHPLG